MGLSPGDASTVDEDRLRLRGLIRTSSGLLINVVEKAAASEDQALVRSIVDAAFFIFSGVESELPGGREFWERMRSNAPGHAGPATVEETRMRQLRALEAFKKELEVYASTRPEIKRLLDGSSAPPGNMADHARERPTGPAMDGPDADITSLRRRPPPKPEGPAMLTAVPVPSDQDQGADKGAAKVPKGPQRADLGSRLEAAETELKRKDALLKDYEDDMRRIYDQLKGREVLPGSKELEERLALQEEETRMAREDLSNMERKYHENMELLKAEARDRGELQKRLAASEGEVSRAQARLKEEEQKLTEARARLEKKEYELEKLGDRLHGLELELVKKEEEIKMAMEHLRDEEAERRRVLEALREEAREKAQMEHRLKKRELELSRLEARIHDDEKRVESLKGSQAVSEEESIKRSEQLRIREEEVRALEAQTRQKVLALRKDEDEIKDRTARLKQELRGTETLEAQMRKREELRAAFEARYRAKEESLVKELRELERAKVSIDEREKELAGKEAGPAPRLAVPTAAVVGERPEPGRPPADDPGVQKAPVGARPDVQAERVTAAVKPAGTHEEHIERRNEILEMLSKRIHKK